MSKCYYPDWEGGIIVSKHAFDKDGLCSVRGELQDVGCPTTKEGTMFDSGPWRCKSCDTVLGWIMEGRLWPYQQATPIDSGDVKCHVCGEAQKFCPVVIGVNEATTIAAFDEWLEGHQGSFYTGQYYEIAQMAWLAGAAWAIKTRGRNSDDEAAQQVVSEMLNEDGYVDTLHLGC